jgi:hypothetical protein
MQKGDKKDEGFKSPLPNRSKIVKVANSTKKKNWVADVMITKKTLEEAKESKGTEDINEPIVGGQDSDNELDDEDGKQIDNSQPLK